MPTNTASWVGGQVVANLLDTSHQKIAQLSALGKIRRRLARVTHVQVRPAWQYNLEDVLRLRPKSEAPSALTKLEIEKRTNATGEFIPVRLAARILGCSTTSIYTYVQSGAIIAREQCFFKYPRAHRALGVRLSDVNAIRRRQAATAPLDTATEEVVLVSLEGQNAMALVTELRAATASQKLLPEEKARLKALLEQAIENLDQ